MNRSTAVSGRLDDPPPMSASPEVAEKPARVSQKMTINVNTELVDDAKNAFWMDRREYQSFSEWVSEAIQNQVELTKTRHGVQELPARPRRDLPAGRPLS